jgi:3-phosphoshikimate 1-carboxyvinyltransferase
VPKGRVRGGRDKIGGVKKQTIHPAKHLTGGVAPPGDKSISHRYAMLSALAEGMSELRHFALAADCHSTLDCMSALGASVKVDKDVVKVTGRGAEGDTVIRDADCAGVSYPTFYEDLERTAER